jgi:hypothetical protein
VNVGIMQGKYADAQPLFQQTLEIREKLLGKQHSDTTTSLNLLALLYNAKGQYAKAGTVDRMGESSDPSDSLIRRAF